MGCPLRNPSLFTQIFLIVLKSRTVAESNFSVKSRALRREQSLSYTEQFLFVLSFNVASYFQLKNTFFEIISFMNVYELMHVLILALRT